MNDLQKYLSSCLLMIAALLCSPSPGVAATAPNLGSAASFAALAGGAVTCTDSVVTGDVGAGTAFTNTRCTISGTVHQGDAAAAAAYADFLSAYATLAQTRCDQVLTTLDGQKLSPGVYCFDAAVASTGGVLTLTGPSTGIWIFKIGTSGTGALTGTNFSVVMENGGPVPCNNVYWWVAQAATLTDSNFVGTILAGADITITRGTFNGDALAGGAGTTVLPTGAVTMTGATVTACVATGGGGGKSKSKCNQGVGNGPELCDPGNSNQGNPFRSNDELINGVPGTGGVPGNPGRKGGNK